MDILVVPFHDWRKGEREGFRTRDAHLIQEFARHPSVSTLLIVNRPSSWAEVLMLRRSWHVRSGEVVYATKHTRLTRVASRAFTLDILLPQLAQPLVLRRGWIPYAFSLQPVADAIETAMATLSFDSSYVLMLFQPLFAPLATLVRPSVLILDAVDNLLKHASYRNLPGLHQLYAFCQERAHVIFTNSSENAAWLGSTRGDVYCIPNGVDTTVFDPTRTHEMPFDLAAIPRPTVGYAGKMQEMIDTDLLHKVVRALPSLSFVFIGQQLDKKWMRPLWRHENVYYLGDKPYSRLPGYLAAFDVCIIPYSLGRQHGVDPIKFYEYLAMGKPVVTTDIGAVSRFATHPQVCVAHTAGEFIGGISGFLRLLESRQTVTPIALPKDCLWREKADLMLRLILTKLHEERLREAP